MIPLRLDEIAAIVGGEVHGDPATLVTGAAYVDTREAVAGGLFVAIAGEHVDGHEFTDGAHAVLGSRPTSAPTVVVDDQVAALGRLAREVVGRIDARVLALTGSQGKTGTKDYLAAVLRALVGADRVVATAANHNNEIGVPLTVLAADAGTTHLVVEMGARGRGHIAYLCEIAPPDVAAVLNIGSAHVGEFGSREAIAEAKGEIVAALGAGGTAVLNADDPLTLAQRDRSTAGALTFGSRGDVAWRELRLDDLGRPAFEIGYDGHWFPVQLRQTGAHQVANAAAAAAFAVAAGESLEAVAHALSEVESASRWRMEVTERPDGLVVINDAYNANPESMRAALEALVAVGARRGRRTVAVLGEMRELGAEHESGHRAVGAAAVELGVDVVLAVGAGGAGIVAGFREARGDTTAVEVAGTDDALEWLRHNAGAGDVVLVKASRGVALERVADGLVDDTGEGTAQC
ncbi:UDP-N-acetylmuramoyl-tripeptide--D-alanyl-D-alanine ligase [Nocardioides panacisoli]|uniref:UDP-N-acetylmuramoyl-tripeptide--D-alanyl-D- alanine ligase n=1 Tax=Nocardioides panacisoli TaxID=627624 RepID=UPI001C6316F4|nr:UDP-N-acetylmuramoyl-tripeptide--D-alanyl-D-alanine ligase [Nocardioides panacisoli]QYJ04739.1 UDP-N-acetylmuramoyl-tripeptide--D-alanyl-D-alanine ligase [Nocardioides panacisoli]